MKNHKMKRGVTLVEIAIVLVIIGLLLGGVLKGQELINNAKVRSIADRQNSLKVAWFSFIDRFQALPGDYVRAERNVPGAADGDGNGEISYQESAIVFQHLTGAGYLRCPQCTEKGSVGANTVPTASNSLQNQYGGVMSIFHDAVAYAAVGGNGRPRLYIHTGSLIPSNIVAEVDRKLDDGEANTGDMVFNQYDPNTQPDPAMIGTVLVAECMATDSSAEGGTLSLSTSVSYRWATATPPVEQNCGASISI